MGVELGPSSSQHGNYLLLFFLCASESFMNAHEKWFYMQMWASCVFPSFFLPPSASKSYTNKAPLTGFSCRAINRPIYIAFHGRARSLSIFQRPTRKLPINHLSLTRSSHFARVCSQVPQLSYWCLCLMLFISTTEEEGGCARVSDFILRVCLCAWLTGAGHVILPTQGHAVHLCVSVVLEPAQVKH